MSIDGVVQNNNAIGSVGKDTKNGEVENTPVVGSEQQNEISATISQSPRLSAEPTNPQTNYIVGLRGEQDEDRPRTMKYDGILGVYLIGT